MVGNLIVMYGLDGLTKMVIEDTTDIIVDVTEDKIRVQIKGFLKESGKKTALITSLMFSLIVSGNFIPQEYIVSFLILVLMIFIGVSFLLIYNIVSKDTKILRTEVLTLNKGIESVNYSLVQLDMTMRGKIANLERFSDDVIFEINYETQTIDHANANFQRVLGWSIEEVNLLKTEHKQDWISWFAMTAVHPDDREKFSENMKDISNIRDTLRYKCWIKRKNGMFFPSTFTVNFLHEPDYKILHCFLTDEEDIQKMLSTIDGQNDLVRQFEKSFMSKSNNAEKVRELIANIKELV